MTAISDRGAKPGGRPVYRPVTSSDRPRSIRREPPDLRERDNIPVAQPRHIEYTAEED